MEVEQLEYQGTLTSTPHAQFDVMPNPEATPARADRDWRLVRALRLREPTAADRLVATYSDRAYRLAVRITGNEQDAEEAVQDAFWSVVRKIDTFRGDSAFGSWVYRIVSNGAYEKIRRRPQAFVDISPAEAAHTDATRSRLTKSFLSSTRMATMRIGSPTGRRSSTTRRCERSFGACSARRSRSFRLTIGPRSSCAMSKDYRWPRSPTP